MLFSKQLSKCWPHFQSVAGRCAEVARALDNNEDLVQFSTTGKVKKQKRKPMMKAQ